jgi:hypothetical protein
MYAPNGPDTFWLDFTNATLGLVTLVFVVALAGAVARELRVVRCEARKRMSRHSK